MRKKLWDLFLDSPLKATRLPWRIYGNHSHKLLCSDYGSLHSENLDNLNVIHHTKENGYWRIVVED